MNAVSFFDGISCGQLALKKAGIIYNNYFASEIDKYAIKVTQKKFPDTIQLGDIKDIDVEKFPKIDIVFAGPPCQSFSIGGNHKEFDDDRGMLFIRFIEILNILKTKNPNLKFIIENVKVKGETLKTLNNLIGVEPLYISSAKFVPQIRKRFYWTNISGVTEPPQADYNVYDYIETKDGFPSRSNHYRFFQKTDLFNTIVASYYKGIRARSRPAVSIRESNFDEDRAAHRMLTPTECESLQGIPKNYTDCVSKSRRYELIGNGWTVDVISYILKKHFKSE